MRRFTVRFVLFTVLFLAFLVAIQDILIFPGILFRWFHPRPAPPPGVERFTVRTEDQVTLDLWREPPAGSLAGEPQPLLFFHGNGGSMAEFFPVQRWLATLGFIAYSVDLRGYGGSEGWPSEIGIQRDVVAAIEAIARREKVDPGRIVIAGLSIGSGAAAYAAAKYQTKLLILLAPFANLRKRAAEEPVIGFLAPLLRYQMPNDEYLSQLKESCVVIAHGEEDRIIQPHHSEMLVQAYRGTGPVHFVRVPQAMHNDLVFRGAHQIAAAIRLCQNRAGPGVP